MTPPKRWTPGERITAERLNAAQTEAMRSRKSLSIGVGSSLVNESLGNQTSQKKPPIRRLVIASEDFTIPDEPTDLQVRDDVPSGLVKDVRLVRHEGEHQTDELGREFRVYDVLGGLNNLTWKVQDEVFYVSWNVDSKRWEVEQTASVVLKTAIVLACLDGGWHECQITDWDGEPNTGESDSVSTSESMSQEDPCDLCALTANASDSSEIEDCESIGQVMVERDTGSPTPEIIYAHTCNLRPMMIGGMIKVLKRPPKQSNASESLSTSASVSESLSQDQPDLYDVVDGVWELAALPFPQYECCTDPVTGEQYIKIIRCDKVIVEGIVCYGEDDPCPDGSESMSASSSI